MGSTIIKIENLARNYVVKRELREPVLKRASRNLLATFMLHLCVI